MGVRTSDSRVLTEVRKQILQKRMTKQVLQKGLTKQVLLQHHIHPV